MVGDGMTKNGGESLYLGMGERMIGWKEGKLFYVGR